MAIADTLILGATLEPMTGQPAAGADSIAIAGGRIAAIGRADELRGMAGSTTRRIELSGETVLPGFGDSHCHPIAAGLTLDLCDLHDLSGIDAYLDAIARYAAEHPDREWITGSGWYMADFPGGAPRREALDAILLDRPVFLYSRDGHDAWLNSLALRRAGVGADTPDPADGRIERDQDGEPTGTLHEGAVTLVVRLIAAPSPSELATGLAAGQRHLQSLGITFWNEAYVERAELETYAGAARDGSLTGRVAASQLWDRTRGMAQLADILERRAAVHGPHLRADHVKLFLDGVVENFAAYLTDPYLDAEGRPTGNHGIPSFEGAELNEIVTAIDREGLAAHFHAIGDGAVRQALDAVEAARTANGMRDTRHHIAHIQVIHPDDIPRFREVGAIANMQPFWAFLDEQMRDLNIPFLGPTRTGWQYPFASLHRAGARLAGGSDWNVTTANPLEAIEVAVRRVWPEDRSAEPFLPNERLDLDRAGGLHHRLRLGERVGGRCGCARGRPPRGPGDPGPQLALRLSRGRACPAHNDRGRARLRGVAAPGVDIAGSTVRTA